VSNATNITQKHPLSLESYVETTKLIALDPWQVDICRRLEETFWLAHFDRFKDQFTVIPYGTDRPYQISPSGLKIDQQLIDQRRNQGIRAAIHAPPQFGKSIIISQCYPAWILGWDPLHRFRLATYNMLHSARFSVVVKHLMQSPEHQSLFPDPAGHLPVRSKVVEWSTNARLGHPDGQASFTALGLQSGFVGTGYDTLLMDDPYKAAEEALSEVIRDKTWRFWTDTASTRATEHSNVFIMFHRYHQDDMGGRAIATGDFDLWRYAAESDGDYDDEESGLMFPDPMGRAVGEYLSSRFGELFYTRQKKNEQVWYSQFQGRPSAKTGKMFNVGLFNTVLPKNVPEVLHWVRAWDNAATEGGGAFTAGPLMAIDAAENIYIFDVERKQVGTAERQLLQETTAERDGKLVQIHVPIDPGSAGIDVAFQFKQEMSQKGYIVIAEKVSGNKTMRAYPFSKAVNLGKVYLLLNPDGSAPEWHKKFKSEFRYFPASTYKDQVDSASDAYSHLIRLFYRGLVVKNVSSANLLHRSLFAKRFGSETIQRHWEVAAAVRIAPDSSRPSGYCITARAPENAYMGEVVFIVAAARMYVDNPIQVLDALRVDLMKHCADGVNHPHVIWLNKGANDVLQVTAQKMDMRLIEFTDEATAGIPEMNYYFQKIRGLSPFYNREGTTRCFALVDDDQFNSRQIRDEGGMLSLRQDWQTWSYTDRGDVQPYGGVTLDCVRMTMYKFALSATALSPEERRMAKLAPELQPEAVRSKLGTPQYFEAVLAQEHALFMLKLQEEETRSQIRDSNGRDLHIGPRAFVHRYKGPRSKW
jgi:phage terminase large subunit-like protein